MLGAFPTVKQPQLRPLRKPKGQRRYVPSASWYAGAGAEEGDLQGLARSMTMLPWPRPTDHWQGSLDRDTLGFVMGESG